MTGTRAEYGALRPVMRAIDRTAGLRLQACISGMHLLRRFGLTARTVERDGWGETFRVPMQTTRDSPAEQALGLGRGVQGMARAFAANRTDVVVVLGDRIEALAGALAGSLSSLAVAHIHGGEVAIGQRYEPSGLQLNGSARGGTPLAPAGEQRTIRTSTARCPSATVVKVIARATGVREPEGIRMTALPPWTSMPMLWIVRASSPF